MAERIPLQAGTVSGLYLCDKRGCPPRPVSKLHLLAGIGAEGDIHANGGKRQVSMLSQEAKQWMEVQEVQGLCFKRYKANIRTEGFSFSSPLPGTRLSVGTAVLSVSEYKKVCFHECELFQSGRECRLFAGCIFLTIEETGIVRKEDKIVIIA